MSVMLDLLEIIRKLPSNGDGVGVVKIVLTKPAYDRLAFEVSQGTMRMDILHRPEPGYPTAVELLGVICEPEQREWIGANDVFNPTALLGGKHGKDPHDR